MLKTKVLLDSDAWNRGYNPALTFEKSDKLIHITRKVLSCSPKSQHRRIILEIGIQISLIRSFSKPRWNFQNENWLKFKADLDNCIRWNTPKNGNYKRLVGAVLHLVRTNIPRGYRKECITGWSMKYESIYK